MLDPTAMATTKTLDYDGNGSDGYGNCGDGNGEGGDGGNGNGNGNGDGNSNGNGGGGVQWMQRRQPPTSPGRLPPPPGGCPLDRRNDVGCRGAAAVESGDRDDIDACNQHQHVVHWVVGLGGQRRQRRRNGG